MMDDATQTFIQKAVAIHGDKYDYSKTIYQHSMQPLTITCRTHGDFLVRPNNHLSSKQGCQKCSKRYHYSQEEFVQEANRIHGSKYDYSRVIYVNNKTKVDILCPKHGVFSQLPATHTCKGGGCKRCANEHHAGQYHKKDTSWFTKRGREIHGDKYDYSKVEYHRYHDKVEIVCPDHGSFFQTAGSHIHNKSGCPTCSYKDYEGGYGRKRFDNHPELKNRDALLYVIRVFKEGECFIKIGITQKTVYDRFNINNRLPYDYEELYTERGKLYDLFVKEQHVKKQFKRHKHVPSTKFNGHSECFREESTSNLLSYLRGTSVDLYVLSV